MSLFLPLARAQAQKELDRSRDKEVNAKKEEEQKRMEDEAGGGGKEDLLKVHWQ
jgi:hypothetical protein